MRFLFTCGGTAGHINPALSVAGRIRELIPDAEILFIGAAGRMESELVPREGFEIRTVNVSNLRRGIAPRDIRHNIKAAVDLVSSLAESKKIIREFKPDVAVGTGGYVCYPVLRAAAALHIPTAVHESNAVPGLTTKLLEPHLDRIMVGFEDSRAHYKNPGKVVVTGTPVRGAFRRVEQSTAKSELGLPTDKPLVLSVWGSLGASYMNEIMVDFIRYVCRQPDFCLIHSAGKRDYALMLERLAAKGVPDCGKWGVEVREYIYDMPRVMAAADLVLCRSGASTLSELAALGKPAVLIPSPNVTNNHQLKNALVLERAGAARVLTEAGLTAEGLLGTVTQLLGNSDELESMAKASAALYVQNARDRIVEIILDFAK